MVRLRGVRKRLGSKQVLDGVDLDVARGESTVIMGQSGTGKSVLLKHVIGLMKPDEGTIELDGADIARMGEHDLNQVRKRMGMLFQGAALFDSLTVGENVGLALREHLHWPDAKVRERVRERLDWVGLEGVEEMKPASLSGGMRKRVGLARAIVMDPEVILYDEPTTGLDPIRADAIDMLIRDMQRRLGCTAIVVTHDMTSAFKVADRMAMLHDGRVVFHGTAEEARTTRDPMVRQFIDGSSSGPLAV
jgi:phospholipid/cholesterol/gamma-HCH transport system ATP-binding protein